MDGLEAFEKSLAAEKEQKEHSERRDGYKKDRRRHQHHRDRDHGRERSRSPKRDDGHRSKHKHRHSRHEDVERHHGHRDKRSRHEKRDDSSDEEPIHRKRKHRDESDDEDPSENDADSASKEAAPKKSVLSRDAWMESPSALEVDFKQKKVVPDRKRPPQEPQKVVSSKELNRGQVDLDSAPAPAEYEFGDEGSSWRMTKLAAVYKAAQQSGRSVDDIAVERFGSLREFDEAREEREELDKRKLYGKGYAGKRKPTGELHRERAGTGSQEYGKSRDQPDSPFSDEESENDRESPSAPPAAPAPALDSTALNRLRAQMMKAKLRRLPEAAQLEAEYNVALASSVPSATKTSVPLGPLQRQLAGRRGEVKTVETKRGRERGQVEENTDMSVEDMVREERRTRGQRGGEGMRLAERIAKDGRFDDDLEYLDENAEKLAKRVHKSEASLRNMAADEFQRLNAILDKCPLCNHDERGAGPIAPVVSTATRVYLTLPTEPELSPGGAVIVPATHHENLLACDDDEWEEVRNFMKSLTRMYHDQGREVVFYENAANQGRHLHAAMVAVPIPYDLGATAPAFFREAMLTADEEWSQHRKIIDTGKAAKDGLGRAAFRRSIAKEMPYFHVWFSLDGGLGHVVEDQARWPKGDLFAREILGGMMDVELQVIKRQGRWGRSDAEDKRVEAFRKAWRRFDWTRVLEEGGQ